ncbi:MAG: hypothetical protein A2284_14485 [Deltaproteobacteria bacterium RIFOXYA12_FULL_61_11]|nr:MAG: hypothetical protein A2284_14485 [Deltaproteobacteria bacterium RIFOXYA12_FULL_61_11]
MYIPTVHLEGRFLMAESEKKRAERIISENLHKFLARAYKDDHFKVQIMTESRSALRGYNLSKKERDYVRNLAWSLDHFADMKLTKCQISKIRKRIEVVKNRGTSTSVDD